MNTCKLSCEFLHACEYSCQAQCEIACETYRQTLKGRHYKCSTCGKFTYVDNTPSTPRMCACGGEFEV